MREKVEEKITLVFCNMGMVLARVASMQASGG